MFYHFIYLAKGFRMRPKVRSTLTQKDAPVLHNKMMSFLWAIKKAKNKKHRLMCSDKHAYTDRMQIGPRSALNISP